MYFVYILQSRRDNGYYIGYTADLKQRLKEHNSGKTRSLRHRLPLDLIYAEEFDSKRDAKVREGQIKSWRGGEAFKRLIGGPRRSRLRRVFAPLPAGYDHLQRDLKTYCGTEGGKSLEPARGGSPFCGANRYRGR